MRMFRSPILLFIFACCTIWLHAQTQLWSGILDPSRAINWSHAGASIPTSETQCGSTIAAYGSSTAPASAATINNAFVGCPANSYVLLGPGTFYLNSTISPGNGNGPVNNVALKGSGANSTFLIFSGQGSAAYNGYCDGFDICGASKSTNSAASPDHTASWTAGYAAGTNSITLSSVTGLSVGTTIVLDQIDDQSDNGGLYVGCEIYDGSSTCSSATGPTSFERGDSSLSTIRGQQQLVTVTSISGSGPYTVGITPGLYASNWNSSHSPGAWWASTQLTGFGVEDLSIRPASSSAGGIYLFNCDQCWVQRVRGDLESSPSGYGWGQVVVSICDHCTVRDSYFYGNVKVDNYVVTVDIASDLLVENNIMEMPGTAQFYNSDCEGCVADYNFSVNPFYSGSSNWLSQSSDYPGIDLYSLAEGNISDGLYSDNIHGTHDLNTQFRNRWDGREQNNGNATNSNTVPVILAPGTRYDNLIGNILGTVGYHTTYKSTPAAHSSYNNSVIDVGYYNSVSDLLTNSTSMFWGNWDTASNAVRWCGNSSDPGWSSTCGGVSEVPSALTAYANPVPSSTTLPASFVYSSKPIWWPAGKAWPSIGPDVTGGNVGQCVGGTYDSSEVISSQSSQCTSAGGTFTALQYVISNPAMDCYFEMGGNPNGTNGVLSFSPSACYGAVSTGTTQTSPASPSSLTGSVTVN